ncbi:MAG: VOC family protein [Thermomicrobium sp.]|nr:VOC family protein [Thermomicrobium sp.]
MLRQIDHLVVLVPDLDQAASVYRDAGFTVVPGGEHPTGTHNALIGFRDGSYLELIAFRTQNPLHRWYRYLEPGGGIVDLCLLSDALLDDVQRVASGGLAWSVSDGSRLRPDGVTIRWKGATPSDNLTGLVPFLIEDVTPRTERVPHGAEAEHANGVQGIAEVVIAVPDLPTSVELWRTVLGHPGEAGRDRELQVPAHRFTLGPHRVVLAAADHPVLRERLTRIGTGPAVARLTTPNHGTVTVGPAWWELHGVRA